MNQTFRNVFNQSLRLVIFLVVSGVIAVQIQAATVSPKLSSQLTGLTNDASVGVVIISFNAPSGLNLDPSPRSSQRRYHVRCDIQQARYGRSRTQCGTSSNTLIESCGPFDLENNEQLQYYMNQARVMAGVDKVRTRFGDDHSERWNACLGSGEFFGSRHRFRN